MWYSGCITLGIEHFLVMFPSALLIAKITNTSFDIPVISLSTILLVCGIGTLCFIAITKKKIPFFLGPSFAYIGFTSYYVSAISDVNQIEEVTAIIFWGYLLAALILVVISLLYRFQVVQKIIGFLFPDVVMGPAISLIGLELADLAVEDAGLMSGDNRKVALAMITLGFTVFASLIKRSFLKNTSVFLGVIAGCVVAGMMGFTNWGEVIKTASYWQVPGVHIKYVFMVPDNLLQLLVAVTPCAIVAFTESLGRIEVLSGMQKMEIPEPQYEDPQMPYHSLKAHSISNLVIIASGAIPNAIYAENLAIMNLNNAELSTRRRIKGDNDSFVNNCYAMYSIYPYIIAAVFSIFVACFGGLQELLVAIPKPVLGGIELFVFGLIAAPGIQLLVEQKVNYKKVSNQIITSSILLAGVSNLSINLQTIELKGMSLGLIIGVILNVITKFLSFIGWLNEKSTLIEILEECIDSFSERIAITLHGAPYYSNRKIYYDVAEMKQKIREDSLHEMLKTAKMIELNSEKSSKKIIVEQNYDKIFVNIEVDESLRTTLCNDYENVTQIADGNRIRIQVNEYFSARKLIEVIKKSI